MFETTDKPGIQERYIAATNTSDLTVEADRAGSADLLIASGWSKSALAAALGHLRGQWDKAGKPKKATEVQIAASAAETPDAKGRPDMRRARAVAITGYSRALRNVAEGLPARAEVLRILHEWASTRSVDPDLLSPAIFHWLSPTCPVCDGRGKMRLPDAPVLGKTCLHCAGTGKWPRTREADRVDAFIRGCVAKVGHEMRERLRNC